MICIPCKLNIFQFSRPPGLYLKGSIFHRRPITHVHVAKDTEEIEYTHKKKVIDDQPLTKPASKHSTTSGYSLKVLEPYSSDQTHSDVQETTLILDGN